MQGVNLATAGGMLGVRPSPCGSWRAGHSRRTAATCGSQKRHKWRRGTAIEALCAVIAAFPPTLLPWRIVPPRTPIWRGYGRSNQTLLRVPYSVAKDQGATEKLIHASIAVAAAFSKFATSVESMLLNRSDSGSKHAAESWLCASVVGSEDKASIHLRTSHRI